MGLQNSSRCLIRCGKTCKKLFNISQATPNISGICRYTTHTDKWMKPKRKRKMEKGTGDRLCVTYATADRYSMETFVSDFSCDRRFCIKNLPVEFSDGVNIEAKDKNVLADMDSSGEIFIFRDGVISFWNINSTMINHILCMSKSHAHNIDSSRVVELESEEMVYSYEDGSSRFQQNKFILCRNANHENISLDMFAFSNALCASVKLAHWEHILDTLINSFETVPDSLIKGRKVKYQTSAKVLRKIGEILLIRHRVNLQYNLLDVPGSYWDHENLEKLYLSTARYFNINRRVHLMNEKLTYCAHMAELLKTDLHEKKSLRVEILIVLLIFIEIVFEVLHLFVLPQLEICDKTERRVE